MRMLHHMIPGSSIRVWCGLAYRHIVHWNMGIKGVCLWQLLHRLGHDRVVGSHGNACTGPRMVDVMGIRRNKLWLLLMKLGMGLLLLELLRVH